MRSALLLGCFLAATAAGGCYGQIVDAVVDDEEAQPGGAFTASIAPAAAMPLPALAKGDPLTITVESTSLVAGMTCGEDTAGNKAVDVLGKPNSQITLIVAPATRSQLQMHAGGQTCVATAGTLSLRTDASLAISGSFETSGHLAGGETPCTMAGTLTGIPQRR